MAGVRLSAPAGRWLVFTTVLGSAMALLDSTVVNVALPHIGLDLGADLPVLQWTVNAYMLTLAGLILLGGALGDRFGRRRVFVTGVVWFALASLACGLAPNAGVLIAARALQGIGGALLTPGSLALIQSVIHPDDRARAIGLWSGFGGVGAAIGPFLGGWLVDGPGWRWVFFLNVPLAAVCVPVALRHVPETSDPQAHGRFDVLGAVLGAAALGLVTYALIAAPQKGASPAVVVPALGGLALGVAFVAVERRRPEPMLPLSIFSSHQFSAVNAVTLCVYAAFGGFFFLSVLDLQVVVGYSALAAGTALLPTTTLMLLLSARSGELGKRIGPRIPLTVGPLLCAVGMLLMTRAGVGAVYWRDILPALVVLGTGMVVLVAPLTATVLASVDVDRAGLASGVNNAAARAAGLVAVAALPLLAGMGPEAYRSADAFSSTFRRAMPICAGVLVLGAVIAWRTVRSDALEWAGAAAGEVPEGAGGAAPTGRAGEGRGAAPGEVAVPEEGAGAAEGAVAPGARAEGAARPPSRPECVYHCGVSAPPLDPGEGCPRALPARPSGASGPDRAPERRVTWLERVGRGPGPGRLEPMAIHENLLGGPPPTHLPDDPEPRELLASGAAPAEVAAKYPASSLAWAQLADEAFEGGRVVESYAYARTGYHRGLDALRRSGWKGHGPVPFEHEPNRGFLRALHALARAAQAIGEQQEYERCSTFLRESSPTAADTLS